MASCERFAATVLWRIEHLVQWEDGFHERDICSPRFKCRSLEGNEWLLRLFPRGETEGDEHLHVRLDLCDAVIDYPIDCECSILDAVGSPLVTGTVRDCVTASGTRIDLHVSPTQEEVFQTRNSEFLPRGSLTVRCRIWKTREELSRAERFIARSRLEVRQASFEWQIESYSTLRLCHKVFVNQDLFQSCPVDLLSFSFTGTSLLDSSVNFEITSNCVSKTRFVTFKVSVREPERDVFRRGTFRHVLSASGDERTWTVPPFLSRREALGREAGRSTFEVLIFFLEITCKTLSDSIESYYYGLPDLEREIRWNDAAFAEGRTLSNMS